MHDSAYKLLFSHPRMVEDRVRGFVPGDRVETRDFSTLEQLPASYVSEDLRQRHEDIVWRVRFRDSWLYVVRLLEFQSTVDPYMAVRILSYTGLLYQDLIRHRTPGPSGKLPPVLPIVIYNGEPRWSAAVEVSALIEPVGEALAAFQPRQRYWLLDEGRYDERALPPTRHRVAALIRLENSRQPADLPPVLDALIEWLQDPAHRELRRAFNEWLQRVLLPARLPGVDLPPLQPLSEVRVMLAERVKEWTAQWRQEGLEQGIAQERALLCRLAARRFDAATGERLAPLLAQLNDPETLARIGEWILECDTGGALIERVQALSATRRE